MSLTQSDSIIQKYTGKDQQDYLIFKRKMHTRESSHFNTAVFASIKALYNISIYNTSTSFMFTVKHCGYNTKVPLPLRYWFFYC